MELGSWHFNCVLLIFENRVAAGKDLMKAALGEHAGKSRNDHVVSRSACRL